MASYHSARSGLHRFSRWDQEGRSDDRPANCAIQHRVIMGIWLAVSSKKGDNMKDVKLNADIGCNLTRVVSNNTSQTMENYSDEESDGLAQNGASTDKASLNNKYEWTGEYHDDSGNSHKFYRITVNNTVLERHWGRAPGFAYYWDRPPLTKKYDTNAEALAAARVITSSKISKGYLTVHGTEEEE